MPFMTKPSAEPLEAPYPAVIDRRAFQRTISVHVLPSGVVKVIAGKTTSKKIICEFLCYYEDWIHRSLDEYKSLRKKYPLKRYVEGERFLFKGEEIFLTLSTTSNKRPNFKLFYEDQSSYGFQGSRSELVLSLPKGGASYQEISAALRSFYKQFGRKQLKKSVDYYSQQMNLYPRSLSFRSQKTRWGSCSSEGNVSLNWRLVAAPKSCLDYVVVHELSHIKYQNHSKKFWNLVEIQLPRWRKHRKWLKEHQYAFDFLAKSSELHYLETPKRVNASHSYVFA